MASGNMKDIKRRIKSVESTKQITKAMQLVASSKLRKAKDRAENAKPFFDELYNTMCEIVSDNRDVLSVFQKKSENAHSLLVVIAGDRGLAGGFNSNVIKLAEERAAEIGKENVSILSIGRRSVEHFRKRGYKMFGEYPGIAETVKIYIAAHIGSAIVKAFAENEIGRCELFYTTYVSPLTQTAVSKKVLPVETIEIETEARQLPVYEPSAEAVFNAIVPKYLAGILYSATVDSFAAEQAARRIAMENATDNAEQMIDDLSLRYNRARQASITQEITEIIGGSTAGE
ncbi:MAG: ATP synthase F1 subunit gamma [Ruminococcus sp.]|jgi:F-type H+-transporting ATPase subunit gamma|nr:ATP synthase F1 subunit gamma [Ruminococcus sp.]